jgi:hypothetical protein
MSRPTHLTNPKIIGLIVAILLLAGGGAWDVAVHHQQPTPPVISKPALTTSLTYRGQEGKTALALLEQHAKVQTKSSSLGEYVVSINGNDGGGEKYWLFYVNGKEAQVGAGAYVTHTGDVIQWKLQ